MCRHAGFWLRGSWAAGGQLLFWRAVRVALCFLLFCFVYSPYLYHCCYCSLCCSVKLPLSRPTSFCLFSFHSPPHPSGRRGSRAATWPFCCRPQLNYNRKERQGKRGGQVALCIRKLIQCEELSLKNSHEQVKSLWVRIIES